MSNDSLLRWAADAGDSGVDMVGGNKDILQVIFISLIIITGFIGNMIMCTTLIRTSKLRTVTNIFTAALGVTDLGIVCLVLPMWLASVITENGDKFYKQLSSGNVYHTAALCKGIGFTTVSLVLISTATLSMISLDRYFCICHPLKYPSQVTSKKVCALLGYICVQSLFFASGPLYGWGAYKFKPLWMPICLTDWKLNGAYTTFILLIGFVIPLIIMAFSYICIFQAARKQARRIQQFTLQLTDPWRNNTNQNSNSINVSRASAASVSDSGTSSRRMSLFNPKIFRPQLSQAGKVYTSISKNLKTLKTVFIVVGVFLICFLPYVIMNFCCAPVHFVSPHQIRSFLHHPNTPPRQNFSVESQQPVSSLSQTAEFVCTLMLFSICAINPLIFMLLTRDFRCAALSLVNKCLLLMQCKKFTSSVSPFEEGSRMKWTTMANEASVHVIRLKQPNIIAARKNSNNSVYDHSPDAGKRLPVVSMPSSKQKKRQKGKYKVGHNVKNSSRLEVEDSNKQPIIIDVTSRAEIHNDVQCQPIVLNVNTALNSMCKTLTQIEVCRSPSVKRAKHLSQVQSSSKHDVINDQNNKNEDSPNIFSQEIDIHTKDCISDLTGGMKLRRTKQVKRTVDSFDELSSGDGYQP